MLLLATVSWTMMTVLVSAAVAALAVLAGVRRLPKNRVGIVERGFGSGGSVPSGLIALGGQAGYQPALLRGGLHWLTPLQYRVHSAPLLTIPQGKIGYIFARDGRALEPTQALASNVSARTFEDVRAFLDAGGQRGPQRQI